MEKVRGDAAWYEVICKHILPIIYDENNYKEECTKKTIDSFVTESDEAFAIVCVLNVWDVCQERAKVIKQHDNDTRSINETFRKERELTPIKWHAKTKYTMTPITVGGITRIRKTWNAEGKYKYGELRMGLVATRKEKNKFYIDFMNKMNIEYDRHTKAAGKVNEEPDIDPDDDSAMLERMNREQSLVSHLESMRREELSNVPRIRV